MDANNIDEYKEFLYVVSHDLRSHMRHVKEFSRLLIEEVGELSDDGKDYEHFLSQAVSQLDEKFTSLLEVSRVNTTSEDLTEECLKDLVQVAVQTTEEKYKFKHKLSGEWPKLKVHSNIFYKMLYAIVENAVKFCDSSKPFVEISCTKTHSEVFITVQDNGPGIPEEYHEAVFDLFKKLSIDDTSTGAGLTYARKVARKHGGDISLSNKEGSGLRARISLPVN